MPLAASLAFALLSSAPAGPHAAAAPPVQAPADPVAGVWKGSGLGDGRMFSRSGAPLTLLLSRGAGDALEGELSLQAQVMKPVRATLEDDGRTLKVAGLINGMPLQGEFRLAGEELSGTLVGLGVSIEVHASRWSQAVLAEPPDSGAVANLASLSDEDWRDDLRLLEEYLPQVHANALHTLSEAEWRASIEDTVARLPELDPLQRVIALARIVAAVGDAHTGLNWREASGFATLPIGLTPLADGLFVTGVHERHGEAIGCRIVRVGAVPIDEALRKLGTLSSAENEPWRDHQAVEMLAVPQLLAILGLIESPDALPFVLEDADGGTFTVEVDFDRSTPWVTAPNPAYDPVPRYLTSVSRPYWFEALPEQRAVYLAYNSCREDPGKSMADFLTEVLAAFDALPARRLVVDLRNNTGGNSAVLSGVLERLRKHSTVGAPGGLVALIGSKTFSSGMRGASDLREIGALLLGTPTGGKPNSFGEVRSFRLPHTGLQVFHSTKRFFTYEDRDPPSVAPDMYIEASSSDYLAGEDPVLAAALAVQR